MGLNTLLAETDEKRWFGIICMSIAIVVIQLVRYYRGRKTDNQLLTPPDFLDTEPDVTTPDSYLDHKQAFKLLHQSRELHDLLGYRPSGTRPAAWSILWISFGLVLVTVAIIGRLESTAAIVLVVLGVWPLGIGVYDLFRFVVSPLKRLPAIIISKSKKAYAGHEHGGSGGAILLVLIETRDGNVKNYHVNLRLFQQIEKEDIGIAYIKGEQILDFKKVTLKEE